MGSNSNGLAPEAVLAELRERIEFHKRIIRGLEEREARINAELKLAADVLSGKEVPSGATITLSAKEAVLRVVNGLGQTFGLKDVYEAVKAQGINVEGANAYKRISSALSTLAQYGVLEKVAYGKYRDKRQLSETSEKQA